MMADLSYFDLYIKKKERNKIRHFILENITSSFMKLSQLGKKRSVKLFALFNYHGA